MSLNLNHVLLAGHLTRDPQIRALANERCVASFSLAINRRYKGPDGEVKEEATFVDCEAWGRTAELVGQYLIKGSACYVEGRLKLDSWQDKDGQKRNRLKVVADTVQFIGRTKEREASADTANGADDHMPAAKTLRETVGAAKGHEEPPF
jgi:single-strand DNA-binding protein